MTDLASLRVVGMSNHPQAPDLAEFSGLEATSAAKLEAAVQRGQLAAVIQLAGAVGMPCHGGHGRTDGGVDRQSSYVVAGDGHEQHNEQGNQVARHDGSSLNRRTGFMSLPELLGSLPHQGDAVHE